MKIVEPFVKQITDNTTDNIGFIEIYSICLKMI